MAFTSHISSQLIAGGVLKRSAQPTAWGGNEQTANAEGE